MEMGAALTVLVFSQYSLPVSTSMCITGATVGVGLCNFTYKAVNWHRIGLLMIVSFVLSTLQISNKRANGSARWREGSVARDGPQQGQR